MSMHVWVDFRLTFIIIFKAIKKFFFVVGVLLKKLIEV